MSEQKTQIGIEKDLVITSRFTLHTLFDEKYGCDAVALYMFYIHKAKKDNEKNRPRATIRYCMQGLSWGEERVRKAKKLLLKHNLISDKVLKNKVTGKVKGWVIHINYLRNPKTTLPHLPEGGKNHRVVPKGTITISTKLNTISTDISIENLENFQGSEINDLITLFKDVNPSYKKLYANKTERKALENLVKEHGIDKVTNMINYLDEIVGMPYAPVITKPTQLENKLGELRAFFKRMNSNNLQKIGGIVDARTN